MKRRPLVIAHRGWSGQYVENTMPAIRAALRLAVDFVEIDVHETRDGEVVVFHDYRLDRICGVRKRVRDATLAEMKRRNPGIPSLAEVLRACRGRARVLIEIKSATPHKVAAVIKRCRMERGVIVFSLSIPVMKAFAEVAPRVPRFGLIARNLKSSIANLKSVEVGGVGLGRRLVTSPTIVRDLHHQRLRVFVWTVNRRAEMRRLIAWGVDGLITNHPDRANSCLARR